MYLTQLHIAIKVPNCTEWGGILMNQVNYETMSNADLKQYFLQHREDKVALQAYLDRLNELPRQVIATPDDPNFDAKILAAIQQQMEKAKETDNVLNKKN